MSTPAVECERAAYTGSALALHWLHAGVLAAAFAIGLGIDALPKGAERSAAIALHKSLGVAALALVALRLGWRLRHRPADDLRFSVAERRRAGHGHRALYGLLLATPLCGYLSSSFTPYPMRVFGLALPKAGWPDATLNALFNTLHGLCAWALLALIAGHLAVVVVHALQGRPVLQRMLPTRRRR